MARRLGLIIGVNSYQDTAFRPLQRAETDARAIAQWLVNTQGGNWSPSDVQLVQGTYATRELVETLITLLCVNVAGPGDLVLVYFAGHAFLDEMNGEGYLALANTLYQQPTTGIHLSSLAQQTMGHSHAAHVVFMLDCFQTGKVWGMRRSTPYDTRPLLGPTLLNALQQSGDRLIFCSCRGNEFAAETSEKNLGVLTYRMIVGLCGPASDPVTKQITLQRLHAFLFSSVDEQRRPQLFGQERTPLVLVGEMPQQPNTFQASGQLSPFQSGQLPSTFSAGIPNAPPTNAQPTTSGILTAQPLQNATATAQMSPTTSGQLMLSAAEQQCTMLLRQARHLIQMQNPAEAFTTVEQALQIVPTNVSALILKAQLLGSVARSQEALYAIEQVLQLDNNNALAWSVRAALLTNTGQHQLALQTIEHSLELDPNNPETYSIKTSIMGHAAASQRRGSSRKLTYQKRGGPASFFIGTGLQILGLLLGAAGAVLPVLVPSSPIMAAFVLQSLGLALICVNAARTSYLYGFVRFLLTLVTSGLAGAALAAGVILGGVNHIGTGRIYVMVQHNTALLLPLLFLGLWLALATALPPLLALFGFIGGLMLGVRRKKR
ncbi:MAG TPA: caspase family protein [Ktedonobacteraceae bacterium]|nr:caspase family protein [Ktedonobacteraceae bacterium]